jgi:hypothetical protein
MAAIGPALVRARAQYQGLTPVYAGASRRSFEDGDEYHCVLAMGIPR